MQKMRTLGSGQGSQGKIVTFYSYKGGVGRTMALANVAFQLATRGKRVLAIDWDLEAPGLPRFFRPLLDRSALESTAGLTGYLGDIQDAAVRKPSRLPTIQMPVEIDLTSYAVPVDWPFPDTACLHLIPAGKRGPAYDRFVTNFNWARFYDELGGATILDRLRQQLRAEYDYVLIDSRTGVNDSAGVCTVQMPDAVVICIGANRQNIEGAAEVAERIGEQRTHLGEPVRILPVPARIERAEKARLDSARMAMSRRFAPYLSFLPPDRMEEYWDSVSIFYEPFYAYEEILCAFGDSNNVSAHSMTASIENLTAYVTNGEVTKSIPIPASQRAAVLDAFLRDDDVRFPKCVISYSSRDREFAERLLGDLQNAGIKCWFAPRDMAFGVSIRDGLNDAIRLNDKVIVILSQDALKSRWVESEVENALEWEAQIEGKQTVLVPLSLDASVDATKVGWAADMRRRRNIGDFAGWKDAAAYRQAFGRLLQSLVGGA